MTSPASTSRYSLSRVSTRAPGRAVLAAQWFEQLSAPSKQLVTFENSGHTPHLHEPGRFATYLSEVVLPQTYPSTA